MRTAFKPFRFKPECGVEDLWAGPVQYVDLTQVRMKGVDMLARFFFKHRAFEWERKYRLAISLRMPEEFGVPIPPALAEAAYWKLLLFDEVSCLATRATNVVRDRGDAPCEVAGKDLVFRVLLRHTIYAPSPTS